MTTSTRIPSALWSTHSVMSHTALVPSTRCGKHPPLSGICATAVGTAVRTEPGTSSFRVMASRDVLSSSSSSPPSVQWTRTRRRAPVTRTKHATRCSADTYADFAQSNRSQKNNKPCLVLYTKPGCCLCDGLGETLGEIFDGAVTSTFGDEIRNLRFVTRDVSQKTEWAERYAAEVPVLTLVTFGGEKGDGDDDGAANETSDVTEETSKQKTETQNIKTETLLPRPAPRLNAARLAMRLGQDVRDVLRGERGTRKGWSVSGGGERDELINTSAKRRWSVVSEKPF